MSGKIRFRIFAHSWLSDWNHGNAHFLRGLARELVILGHEVRCYEELGSWSLTNLVKEGEIANSAIEQFRREFPQLDVRFYQRDENLQATLTDELRDADIVIVHEWTEPSVAAAILSLKHRFGFHALFHDTHHRAYTNAAEILRFPLHLFDGVLAFGPSGESILTASECRERGPSTKPRTSNIFARSRQRANSTCYGSAIGAMRNVRTS
jgi:spore maturation protein CgeB